LTAQLQAVREQAARIREENEALRESAAIKAGWVHRRIPGFQLASLGFVLQGVGAALFALSPIYPLSLLAAMPIGLGFSFNTAVLNSRLQELSPEEFRGRVMSTFAMAHLGMRPFSALLAGALASVAGARVAMLAFALVAPLGLWILYRGTKGRVETAPAT
jgi:hypothetical protein